MLATNSTQENPSLSKNEVLPVFDTEWMEGESIRSFITTQGSLHMIATIIVVPIVIAVLYEYSYRPALLVWLGAISLLTAYRWSFLKHYQKFLTTADTQTQLAFNKKYAWTWVVTAFLWGSLVLVFFAEAPLFNQLVCWVVLAGIGGFAAVGYAAHRKTMLRFVNTMFAVMLFCLAWKYIFNTQASIDSLIYAIFRLQLVFWLLLILMGNRFNRASSEQLNLLKGNYELIDSLKAETLRANQAIETKNRFLASAAHDIRQPVLALDVYASMLRAEPDMAGVLTEKIEIATKSVIAMFDSLFDLSRLDAGQLKISNSTLDVMTLMRELELQYQPASGIKKLEFRMRSCNVKIYTDQQLLKRILGNLLMNAIKFTNQGGVLLACRQTQEGVRFEIWDTGVGIAADEQTAVFGEFYKSPSHLGTSDGFGLGLSIVSRLCEPLGFNFSMKSSLGRGSVFRVEVPTVAPQ